MSRVEEEQIDPMAYFVCTDQTWDPYTGKWVKRKAKPIKTQKSNGRLLFRAYNRVWGVAGSNRDDYTWIEFHSEALTDLLRSEQSLKDMTGLFHKQPGIDARCLFQRLRRLKELSIEPKENQGVVPSESLYTKGAPDAASNDTEPTHQPDEEDLSTTKAKEARLTAQEQLFILVKFIEEHFRDIVEELQRLEKDGYMPYNLLWTICVPGSIVEIKDTDGYSIGVKVHSWKYEQDTEFNMDGFRCIWDGLGFKWDQVSQRVKAFEGLIKAGQLPIKIMSEQVCGKLVERGKVYEKFAGLHYLQYNSFMFAYASMGHKSHPAQGRVMLDTAGYYRFALKKARSFKGVYIYKPSHEDTRDDDTADSHSSGQFEDREKERKQAQSLPDHIICLFPSAHYGWSFTAKLWGRFSIDDLQQIVFDELAFDQLVLKQEYKKMIKALIETNVGQEKRLVKDLVAGKGAGMVMVLHGKPGTGKTLTAEAISEHLRRPLYTVSSGELGIAAAQLESQLKDILEMTALWGAVVLIDEADVFLEARNTHDLVRNSLVSVFLRLLERHTGVLILTTNRIRSFDTAFVSRFSIALHYPDLDQESRLLIWKEFLSRAGFKIGGPQDQAPSRPLYLSYGDVVGLAKRAMNGRVIKQLVKGAQALAMAEKEPLELSHIDTVLGITEQFEADWKELGAGNDIGN